MTELLARAGEKDAGRKVKYFVRGDMHVSSGQFRALKMTDGLRVNGELARADDLLHPGDLVAVRLSDHVASKSVLPEQTEVCIPYEDADIYIVDKPAPLPCQCSERQPSGTLENQLYARFSNEKDFVFRPLNRLDKGTSGLLAAAKHAHACQILQKQLHTPAFVREYLAVVEGELTGEGVIDLPIAKADGPTIRRCVDIERGRRAVTRYRAEAQGNGRTLVRLRLETGRTHQIRVHMAAIGHPVAGDFLYGTELEALPGRFALHSAHIAFDHPLTGERITLSSELPEALRRLMEP